MEKETFTIFRCDGYYFAIGNIPNDLFIEAVCVIDQRDGEPHATLERVEHFFAMVRQVSECTDTTVRTGEMCLVRCPPQFGAKEVTYARVVAGGLGL
jgi:hypothetical protein